MKRRSFLGAVIGSLFGGVAATFDPLSRFRSYFTGLGFGPRKANELAQQTQTMATDLASFDNSRGVATWNERERCWVVEWLPPTQFIQHRKRELSNGSFVIESRCCERSPWYHRAPRGEFPPSCDRCTVDMREVKRLIAIAKKA